MKSRISQTPDRQKILAQATRINARRRIIKMIVCLVVIGAFISWFWSINDPANLPLWGSAIALTIIAILACLVLYSAIRKFRIRHSLSVGQPGQPVSYFIVAPTLLLLVGVPLLWVLVGYPNTVHQLLITDGVTTNATVTKYYYVINHRYWPASRTSKDVANKTVVYVRYDDSQRSASFDLGLYHENPSKYKSVYSNIYKGKLQVRYLRQLPWIVAPEAEFTDPQNNPSS